MADKIENKQIAEKQQDNTLSNLAFDLMKGAAGAVAGVAMNKDVRDAATNVVEKSVAGGINAAIEGKKAIENIGAAAAGAAANTAGAGIGKVGKELIKENKDEINKGVKAAGEGAKALENELKRQGKELMDTPKDVLEHFKKRPLTTIAEGALGGPGAVILDAKLRKWFGDK